MLCYVYGPWKRAESIQWDKIVNYRQMQGRFLYNKNGTEVGRKGKKKKKKQPTTKHSYQVKHKNHGRHHVILLY